MYNRITRLAALCLAVALGLNSVSAAAPSDASQTAAPRQARWALVSNWGVNAPSHVSVYSVVPGSGALIRHSQVQAVGTGPVVAHPSGRFAYLLSEATRTVQAFRFDGAAGTLTAASSVTLPVGTNPIALAVEPRGGFLYVASTGSNTVTTFWIQPRTGALVELPRRVATGAAPTDIAVDPYGRFVFVSNWVSGSISAYRIVFGMLVPVHGSPFATEAHPMNLAVHPNGRFLYATHTDTGRVSAFNVGDRGTIAPVSGSPFPAGLDPAGVTASVDGRTLYVAEPLLEQVLVRRIDRATGALSDGQPPSAPAGNNVRTVRMDPSGRFLYVFAETQEPVWVYSIDATGAPTPVSGSPFSLGQSPLGLALVQ
jgi:6-phosphogluconolactonase (cycloisomerase 2 family)